MGTSTNDFILGPSVVSAQFQQQAFPWPDAKPIQTRGLVKPREAKPVGQKSQEVFPHGYHNKAGNKSNLSNPIDPYFLDTIHVPAYTSYISLKQNILTENRRTMLIYPYFDDFQDEDDGKVPLWDELQARYHIVADDRRRRRIIQAEQSWQLRSYAETYLADLACEMKDVLRYFLLPSEVLDQNLTEEIQPHEAKYLLTRREESCKEEFRRERKRWRTVLKSLPPSTPAKLTLAAIFCPAWLSVFGFSFWHIARRTPSAQPPNLAANSHLDKGNDPSGFAYRDLACRVCHMHNCPFHGAMLEQPDLSEDSENDGMPGSGDRSSRRDRRSPSSGDSNHSRRSSTSSIHSLVNFKKHVNAKPREHPDDDVGQPTRRSAAYWASKSKTHVTEERPPFFPCSHTGSCADAKCSCYMSGVTCEKTCACSTSCNRRFRGCICAQQGIPCYKSSKCDCRQLNRECDPDLCASCGAAEVLDPVNKYNEAVKEGRCANVSIQRNVPKRTLLGQSELHGFGLYMGEKVSAGEFIGEYKGETIAVEEGSRRGAVYQHLKTNYLFTLNKGKLVTLSITKLCTDCIYTAQEVDSTKAGNKFRFINNSTLQPNCEPQVKVCNTVVRIGMFATKDVDAGEELFFNYKYVLPTMMKQVQG